MNLKELEDRGFCVNCKGKVFDNSGNEYRNEDGEIEYLDTGIKFKIFCLQRSCYFADGEIFDSLEDIKEQLIDYHSIDWEEDIEVLQNMNLKTILEFFEWNIQDETEDYIVLIGGKD